MELEHPLSTLFGVFDEFKIWPMFFFSSSMGTITISLYACTFFHNINHDII